MTTFLFIRHGAHLLGSDRIAGRTPGASLSPLGREQAARMVERVGGLAIVAVYSSSMERTVETATPLARRLGLEININDAFAEIDFGEWAGAALADLRPRDAWKRWNSFRSGAAAPGGERMLEAQARAVGEVLRLADVHGEALVAVVSHADVIRAVLAYFLGIPLDLFQRIEISLASVSVVRVAEWGPWVLGVNGTGEVTLG